MFRICALNESDSESESDTEHEQVETREAQEAHLLDLYNSALQHLVKQNRAAAADNLLEITQSQLFISGDGSEQIQKVLRYNVHKNLAECYVHEKEYQLAEDHFFEASRIDRSDVSLWFSLAGVSAKLNHLHMCKGALEEGFACSPYHWPCLENLIAVKFKLDDNMGCLQYCELALERDPENKQAKLYKSKVYNEMPFLQEALGDTDFKPQPTQLETYYYLPPPPAPRPPITGPLVSVTWRGLGDCILTIHSQVEGTMDIINPIDTKKLISDCRQRQLELEESKVQVSVQNLVEEMIDIIEDEEDILMMCEDILDDVICEIFGVPPPTESEKIVKKVLNEIVDESVEAGEKSRKRSGMFLDPKLGIKKKHFSIFDSVPESLIEKRRSCRKMGPSVQPSVANSAETSQDVRSTTVNLQDPSDLLLSFLPPSLRTETSTKPCSQSPATPSATQSTSAKKSLFSPSPTTWLSPEEEEKQVCALLASHPDSALMELMRGYMSALYSMAVEKPGMVWSSELVTTLGQVYSCWRSHWASELDSENDLSRELLRYYIIGNECRLLHYLEAKKPGSKEQDSDSSVSEELPPDQQLSFARDLLELGNIIPSLPPELVVRVRSLRFHFSCVSGDEEEAYWEGQLLLNLYEEEGRITVCLPLPSYPMVTADYIQEHAANLARTKQLEQLNTLFQDGKYSEIVHLLSATLDSAGSQFTPSKEAAARTPDRESQIDIFIESLYHTQDWARCLKWTEVGFYCYYQRCSRDTSTGEERTPGKAEWETLGAYLITFHNCLHNLENEGSTALDCLPIYNAARLTASLVRVISSQVLDEGLCLSSSLPWMLLHELVAWQEKSCPQPSIPSTLLPGSLAILCTAHECLGLKSACTLEQGRLLNYIVDIFIPLMTGPIPLPYVEQMRLHLDQAIYCLYAHPSKKSRARHLVDHNVSQIGLKWDRALVLYRYIKPHKLPEHDDVRTASISLDAESLLKRIVALIPDKVNISKRKQLATDYLTGKTKKIRGLKKLGNLPLDVRDLFYLLADFTFKSNSEMDRAIEFYSIDLTFNRDRFDTWAALALAQGSKMDYKLNACRELLPMEMLAEVESVEMCFKECLRINGNNSNLWIEFGNFSYSIHSYISRTLQNSSESLNFEAFDRLETRKEDFLKLAQDNYQKTLDIFAQIGLNVNDVDERWLLYFMMGKIKEKQGVELSKCLDCYLQSVEYMKNNEVVMPRKVNYNSPQDFTIEALEVYYRIHASIIKSILKSEKENKILEEDTCKAYYNAMRKVQMDDMFTSNSVGRKERWEGKKRKAEVMEDPVVVEREDETSTTIMRDVLEVVDTMIDDVEWTNDTTKYSMKALARLALLGLEDVVTTFQHHFKSIYRMAHYYHNSPVSKNPRKVKQLMLAVPTDRCQAFPGLFGGRKPNFIFNEVWRIPVSEVDRPGSFATHCGKGLILLLDVLKSIPDVNTLVEISVQLRNPPSAENKFLHESDRTEIVTMASTYLAAGFRSIIAKVDMEKERRHPVQTLEMYKLYQKLLKVWPGKEKDILVHLKDLYALIKGRQEEKDKISDSEVIKFCAQEATKARALANAATRPAIGPSVPAKAVPPPVVATSVSSVESSPASTTTGKDLEKQWAQWGQVLADQQRMMQFQQMLAMAPALPNMTPQDMAAICGLTDKDLAGLSDYMRGIHSLNCSQLAQMGITSSQLSSLAQIAPLTGGSQASVQTLATKQAQFEQEYLRKLIGGTGPSFSPSATSKPSAVKITPVSKPSSIPKTPITSRPNQMQTSQKLGLTQVKQTVNFKPKAPQSAVLRKTVQKVTRNTPGSTVTPVSTSSVTTTSTSSSVASNLSMAQKLSASGVTLSKPGAQQPRVPQGVSITKQPPTPDLSKKFPHLNITNIGTPEVIADQSSPRAVTVPASSPVQSARSSPVQPRKNIQTPRSQGQVSRPQSQGIQVKSPAQLLKPAAAAAIQASRVQQAKTQAARPQSVASGSSNSNSGQGQKMPMDQKSKLAQFKAQMKKTLNIPGAQRKPPQKPIQTQTSVVQRPQTGPPGSRPTPQSRPVVPSVSAAAAALSQKKKPPQSKPGGGAGSAGAGGASDDVICIDID